MMPSSISKWQSSASTLHAVGANDLVNPIPMSPWGIDIDTVDGKETTSEVLWKIAGKMC